MPFFENLIEYIQSRVKENHSQEIYGDLFQKVLIQMVAEERQGRSLAGVVTAGTASVPYFDSDVFYIGWEAGLYPFAKMKDKNGHLIPCEVPIEYIGIFKNMSDPEGSNDIWVCELVRTYMLPNARHTTALYMYTDYPKGGGEVMIKIDPVNKKLYKAAGKIYAYSNLNRNENLIKGASEIEYTNNWIVHPTAFNKEDLFFLVYSPHSNRVHVVEISVLENPTYEMTDSVILGHFREKAILHPPGPPGTDPNCFETNIHGKIEYRDVVYSNGVKGTDLIDLTAKLPLTIMEEEAQTEEEPFLTLNTIDSEIIINGEYSVWTSAFPQTKIFQSEEMRLPSNKRPVYPKFSTGNIETIWVFIICIYDSIPCINLINKSKIGEYVDDDYFLILGWFKGDLSMLFGYGLSYVKGGNINFRWRIDNLVSKTILHDCCGYSTIFERVPLQESKRVYAITEYDANIVNYKELSKFKIKKPKGWDLFFAINYSFLLLNETALSTEPHIGLLVNGYLVPLIKNKYEIIQNLVSCEALFDATSEETDITQVGVGMIDAEVMYGDSMTDSPFYTTSKKMIIFPYEPLKMIHLPRKDTIFEIVWEKYTPTEVSGFIRLNPHELFPPNYPYTVQCVLYYYTYDVPDELQEIHLDRPDWTEIGGTGDIIVARLEDLSIPITHWRGMTMIYLKLINYTMLISKHEISNYPDDFFNFPALCEPSFPAQCEHIGNPPPFIKNSLMDNTPVRASYLPLNTARVQSALLYFFFPVNQLRLEINFKKPIAEFVCLTPGYDVAGTLYIKIQAIPGADAKMIEIPVSFRATKEGNVYTKIDDYFAILPDILTETGRANCDTYGFSGIERYLSVNYRFRYEGETNFVFGVFTTPIESYYPNEYNLQFVVRTAGYRTDATEEEDTFSDEAKTIYIEAFCRPTIKIPNPMPPGSTWEARLYLADVHITIHTISLEDGLSIKIVDEEITEFFESGIQVIGNLPGSTFIKHKCTILNSESGGFDLMSGVDLIWYELTYRFVNIDKVFAISETLTSKRYTTGKQKFMTSVPPSQEFNPIKH